MSRQQVLAPCGRPFRVGVFVRLVGGERAKVVSVDPNANLVFVKVSHETDPRLPDHPDVRMDRMPADPKLLRVEGCSAC